MQYITDLLKKYTSLKPPNESVRNAIKSATKEVAGIEISKKNIRCIRGTATLKIPPTYKSKVLLHKEEIISKVNEVTGNTSITEIR